MSKQELNDILNTFEKEGLRTMVNTLSEFQERLRSIPLEGVNHIISLIIDNTRALFREKYPDYGYSEDISIIAPLLKCIVEHLNAALPLDHPYVVVLLIEEGKENVITYGTAERKYIPEIQEKGVTAIAPLCMIKKGSSSYRFLN